MSDEKKAPEGKREREPYEKPSLAAIDLTADQVLGFGCKATVGAGFGSVCLACQELGS